MILSGSTEVCLYTDFEELLLKAVKSQSRIIHLGRREYASTPNSSCQLAFRLMQWSLVLIVQNCETNRRVAEVRGGKREFTCNLHRRSARHNRNLSPRLILPITFRAFAQRDLFKHSKSVVTVASYGPLRTLSETPHVSRITWYTNILAQQWT